MENILITGASGLIGSMLTNLLNNNYNLVCLVRDANKIDQKINAEFIISDIRDESLINKLEGLKIDTIYHLAALNPLIKDKKLQRSVNIDGMRNMINIAINLDIKNFIYAQGMGVFGNKEDIDEDTPRDPDTEFAKIRFEAEQILLDASKEHNFNTCIPILGDVYGYKGWFVDMIINRLKNNTFKIPGSGEYYRSFVHVYDASNALKMLGENGKEGYYIVCDDHPTKFKDFVFYTADRLGVKRPGKVPAFLARAVISGDMLKLLTRSVKANNSKLKNELNFNFRFPEYKSGIDDVLRFIQSSI
jgi:nucleoside-diphosphate-sugar epimerase